MTRDFYAMLIGLTAAVIGIAIIFGLPSPVF